MADGVINTRDLSANAAAAALADERKQIELLYALSYRRKNVVERLSGIRYDFMNEHHMPYQANVGTTAYMDIVAWIRERFDMTRLEPIGHGESMLFGMIMVMDPLCADDQITINSMYGE